MAYDFVKFERGQVWMVRFKKRESIGHEQDKDRPYLILSVGKFNNSSGMITAVPITTRDAIVSPAQVMYINGNGRNNVILCEQIRSFDYMSGAYIFDFMGVVSSEILDKVDVALSIHLGLHYSPITLNKLYDSMEAIIKSVAHMQSKVDTPRFTDDDVIAFAEKLQSLANITSEVAVTEESRVITSESFPEDSSSLHQEETISNSVEQKSSRVKWTPELCRAYLHDTDTLPMKQVMSKWNIEKKTRYYSMKHYAKTLLAESVEKSH